MVSKTEVPQKVLLFEYYEQVMALLNLERTQRLRTLEVGGAVDGDRLDKYEDQAWEEARRQEFAIRGQLSAQKRKVESMQVVSDPQNCDTVQLGTFVTLREVGTSTDETYFIGGSSSATDNRISAVAPLGSALIGCRISEVASVTTPRGKSSFKISQIQVGVKEYLASYLIKLAEQSMDRYHELSRTLGIQFPLDPQSAQGESQRKLFKPSGPKETAEAYAVTVKLLGLLDELTHVLEMAKLYSIAMATEQEVRKCLDDLSTSLRALGVDYPGLSDESHICELRRGTTNVETSKKQ
jgi:transcription elongation GreA/GreB family factor